MPKKRKSLAVIPRDTEAEIAAIRADVTALETKDLEIVQAMDRFADDDPETLTELSLLDERDLKAKGWTKRQLRVARFSLLPRSETPFALIAAHERTLARTRRHTEEASGTTINAKSVTFNIPAPAPRQSDSAVKIIDVVARKK